MPAAGVTVSGTDAQSTLPATPSNPPQPVADAPSVTTATEAKENTKLQENVKENKEENAQVSKETQGFDDFGLPIRMRSKPEQLPNGSSENADERPEAQEFQPPTGAPNINSETQPKQGTVEEKVAEATPEPKAGAETGTIGVAEEPAPSDIKSGSQHDIPPVEKPAEGALAESAPPRTSLSNPKKGEISEWSHMRLAQPVEANGESDEEEEPEDWQAMPALGEFDYYDDYGRLIARGAQEEDDEAVYQGLGGAGKGYTRVQLDEDAQSATSMDEDTSYLFRETGGNQAGLEGEELRDTIGQLQATKDFLNETQKIAYVGVVRLAIHKMNMELAEMPSTKGTRKALQIARDNMRKWGQAMMGRLYAHMDINTAEQIMIEQLAGHGVQPEDLIRPLMQNARVKNPMAESDGRPSASSTSTPTSKSDPRNRFSSETAGSSVPGSPPPYEAHEGEGIVPEVQTPSQMPTSDRIDIDLRWTVLCDLFLVLIADSAYDARSRTLLERVGAAMDVTWLQISRFEKRVTDALEMQEQADKENWDETEHMEKRRQMSQKRKYMLMGLATVGGGLVIGLSAGLLAPVIGAGLAAGLTTVGISGTSAFLGGVGGTALIASGASVGGSVIGLKASHRRTGAVQTFEYRPLHNNKKLNLIVTVSGWMTGKVDDVRLPYSTVDPIMGDIYSVLWEPEMLRSMGDTINILATEALATGLQQVLGSTVLMALMASLQLPLVLTKLAYLIDNPWNVSLSRAHFAGLIMADSLQDRNLGSRPITLLGFSLGARVIFSCLKELSDKGGPWAHSEPRSVVSGRFVNGYSKNDWILGYLFRATSGGIMRVSGLAPIEGVPGIESFDLTELVNGHMDYRAAMPRLLREVGWEVLEDEFAEIEDPDPDSHAERQRELIREIDEARREAEQKPEKKRFGLFKRGKMAEKKAWETYDVDRNSPLRGTTDPGSAPGTVLFDIEAIRSELASEAIEVKQLESTLPPMKLDLNPQPQPPPPVTPKEEEPKAEKYEAPPVTRTASEPRLNTMPHATHESEPYKEDELEMTFDTSYHEPPPPQYSFSNLTRPELRSTASLPNNNVNGSAAGAMALEHNAWADDHDGGFSMTFE
ncbi:hypothetical protein N7454_006974 [Penicillium verhagenii]|nr:hypothetical protein N7454_006974 [Penicillium verhagenii]